LPGVNRPDRGRGQIRVSRISSVVLDRTHLRTRTVVLDQTLAFQPLQPVRRLPAPIAT
jgi:hypothetical protein